MTELTDLSPITQRLVNAYEETSDKYAALAAVLRSVVNDVAPEDYESFNGNGDYDNGREDRNESIREAILEVCDELEKI